MKWFVKCIRNYVDFTGRARRAEYWYFTLFALILLVLASLLDLICFGAPNQWIYRLTALFLIVPSVSVLVRRMHDIGRSGTIVAWYYFAAVVWSFAAAVFASSAFESAMSGVSDTVPNGFVALLLVGGVAILIWSVYFLVWCCTPGIPGDNEYGPDPKADGE